MRRMLTIVFFLFFLFLQYLDATITGIGLALGLWEGNPIGTPNGKIVLIVLTVFCVLALMRLWPSSVLVLLTGLCLLFTWVVVWNLTLLWWWVA